MARDADQVRTLFQRRRNAFNDRTALRLSHHEVIGELTIDYYAGYLLLTAYRDHDDTQLRRLGEHFTQQLMRLDQPVKGVIRKDRPDNLSHKQVDQEGVVLLGDRPPAKFEVSEGPCRYWVSFEDAGFGTGLFLDMYHGRQYVRKIAADHPRVLNLFSYTGPFSIAAAVGGATQVVEVDTSGKWLGWSQDNRELNQITDDTTVIRSRKNDAVKYVSKLDDASFDLIVCDPPSYANPKRGKRFTVQSGYREMMPHFERVLDRHGIVLACCNHAQTAKDRFRSWFGGRLQFKQWIDIPVDFADADYLKIGVFAKA